MTMKWYGDQIAEALQAELADRLARQAATVTNYAKKQMSRIHAVQKMIAAGYRRTRAERRLARGFGFRGRLPREARAELREMAISLGMGGRRYYLDPSKPGEYPKRRTGFLRNHIIYAVDPAELVAQWGISADPQAIYGKYLELGTARMQRRPWMSRANVETRSALKAIMEKPLRALAGTPLASVSAETVSQMVVGGGE